MNTMTKRVFLAAALCAPLAGCGDKINDILTGTGATGSCSQTVVATNTGGTMEPLTRATVPFATTATGRLDITVDWTNAANPVGVYVAQASSCAIEQFNANACTFSAQSQTGGKPRQVSVANAAAGAYELYIVNFSDTVSESVTAQVVLSQGIGCPAFTPNGSAGGGAHAVIRRDVQLH